MTFDDYLFEARKTARYPRDKAIEYLVLGLASEAGEVAAILKRGIRGDDAISDYRAELGDVLWYLALLADELDFPLTDVARYNLEKLRDRQNRGVISGSGDQR